MSDVVFVVPVDDGVFFVVDTISSVVSIVVIFDIMIPDWVLVVWMSERLVVTPVIMPIVAMILVVLYSQSWGVTQGTHAWFDVAVHSLL